jgi:DNA-binding transcriptional LysR family regulator
MPNSAPQLKGLSLDRLAGLVAVRAAGHMAAAAGGRAARQSLLSRQIKELEEHFGCDLLDRSASPRRLTAAGESLAAAAADFFRALGALGPDAGGGRVPLVLGGGEAVLRDWLIPRLRGWAGLRRARLVVRNLPGQRLAREVELRRVDLGLARAGAVPAGLRQQVVADYGYRLCLPGTARGRGPATWAGLAGRPLALLEGDGGFRRFLLDEARARGVELDIAFEATSHAQVARAVAALGLAGFLPAPLAERLAGPRLGLAGLEGLDGYRVELALICHPRATADHPLLGGLWGHLTA